MDAQDIGREAPAPLLPRSPAGFLRFFVWRWRRLFLAALLLQTAGSVCAILLPWALGRILRGVVAAREASALAVDVLLAPLGLFLLLVVVETLFSRLTDAIQVRMRPRLRQEVVRELYHYLQHHSHRFLTDHFAGALSSRISEAAMAVPQAAWIVLTELWPVAVALVLAMVLLFAAHAGLGAFFLAWAILFVAVSWQLARRSRPWAQQASAARSETNGRMVDSINNLQSARLFARLGHERGLLAASQAGELAIVLAANRYTERVRWFQQGAAAILKGGTLVFALYLWSMGNIDVGVFVMAVTLSFLVISESQSLSRRFLDLFDAVGNLDSGVSAIVRPHEVRDEPDARPMTIREGRIEFRAVSFAYGPGAEVFRDLSVTIPAGQRVGLVGYSGSGKSTFVNLILRQFDPQSGSIAIDGVDLRAMPQDSLHGQVGLIPQDPGLFHRSLRDNIRYGRLEASDAEVEAAARRAHAHEFIVTLPEGYASQVGERGVKLSGGQRQRIAIARVLLKNAPILILDEATSSLDSVTEKTIQHALDEDMAGKTVVVVAHRLSTIAHLDRILVFESGRIVEDGSHADLLRRHGVYWRLWSHQADGFLPERDV